MSVDQMQKKQEKRHSSATYSYLAQKLVLARSVLMVPHPNGEDESFAQAIAHCRDGLNHFDSPSVSDPSILDRIAKIRGVLSIPVSDISFELRREFAWSVNELASWAEMRLIQ